jgi:hypothetical protein
MAAELTHDSFSGFDFGFSEDTDHHVNEAISENAPLSNLLFHYKSFQEAGIRGLLMKIFEDILDFESVHEWDENLVQELVKFAKSELLRSQVDTANYMINFNLVQEVHTVNGSNVRRPAAPDPSPVLRQFFPSDATKVRLSQSFKQFCT